MNYVMNLKGIIMINSLKDFQKSLIDNSKNNVNNYHIWKYNNSKVYININKVESLKYSATSQISRCFDNCLKIAIKHPELKYIEGYTNCFNIPFEHAFLVNDSNEVIDPTLAIPTMRESERYGSEYYGVYIPRENLMRYKSRKNTFIPMPYMMFQEIIKK